MGLRAWGSQFRIWGLGFRKTLPSITESQIEKTDEFKMKLKLDLYIGARRDGFPRSLSQIP